MGQALATDYLDITAVREKNKALLFAHKSQHGEGSTAGITG